MSGTHDIKQEIRKYWGGIYRLADFDGGYGRDQLFEIRPGRGHYCRAHDRADQRLFGHVLFMHLISERKLVYVILGFVVFFFLCMMLLIYASYFNLPEGVIHVS